MKKISLLIPVLLVLGMTVPAIAAPSGYTDGCILRGNVKICPLK